MSTELTDLTEAFRMQWQDAQALARRSVVRAWDAGQTLAAIKATLPHGQWLPWLEAEGVAPRTAQKLMRLGTIQIRRLGAFETIDEALQSLAKPAPEPAPEKSGAEIIAALKEELRKKDDIIEGLIERIAIVEESASPEVLKALHTIDENEETIRALKASIGEKTEMVGKLRREGKALRREGKVLREREETLQAEFEAAA